MFIKLEKPVLKLIMLDILLLPSIKSIVYDPRYKFLMPLFFKSLIASHKIRWPKDWSD